MFDKLLFHQNTFGAGWGILISLLEIVAGLLWFVAIAKSVAKHPSDPYSNGAGMSITFAGFAFVVFGIHGFVLIFRG